MITFTINAFIDINAPGNMRLEHGPFACQTAIPLPPIAYIANVKKMRSYFNRTCIDSPRKGVGHLTDQRVFVNCPTPCQTQRMQSTLKINYQGEILTQNHVSSPTIEVDLCTGERRATKTANLKGHCVFIPMAKWKRPQASFHAGLGDEDRRFAYQLEAKGSNPLVSMSWMGPIRYGGELTITIRPRKGVVDVYFNGHSSRFPSFESFVQLPGSTVRLFCLRPKGDVTSLLYGTRRDLVGATKVRLTYPCAPRHSGVSR